MGSAEIPFDELQEHAAFVRALARSLVRDEASADDAVQETWLAAVRSPPRRSGKERSWLAKVVRNAVRQQRRSAGRRSRHEHAAAKPDAARATEDLAARDEIFRRVSAAVLHLPDEYRVVVMLRFYEGLPPRKIAARLGLPTETVRTRQKRALERLRRDLDTRYGGDREAWKAALLPLAGLSWGGAVVGGALGLRALAAVVLLAAAATVAVAVWRSHDAVEETPSERAAVPAENGREPARAADDGPVLFGARDASPGGVGTVVGRVLRLQTGAPEPGARVAFVAADGGAEPPAAVTDETGRFRAPPLTAGRRFALRVATSSVGERSLPVFEVPADRVLDLGTLWVGARGRVEGRIVDRRDAPVAGAEVTVHPGTYPFQEFPPLPDEVLLGLDRPLEPMAAARSDGAGAFVLEDVAPGPLTLVAAAPGFGQAVRRLVMTREGLTEGFLTVTVVEAAPILGVVVDAAGGGVGGARVALVPDSGRTVDAYARQLTTTDAAGRFLFDAPPRAVSCQVAVAAPDHPSLVTRMDGRVRTLRLVLGGGARLRMRLLDESTGNPVAGARLLVTIGVGDGPRPTGRHVASAHTDASGRAELVVEPGVVELLLVRHPRLGMAALVPARQGAPSALDPGSHADGLLAPGVNEWEVRLRPAERVEGRITDARGHPLAGAACRIMGPHGLATCATDEEGRYALAGQGPGMNVFSVDAAGHVQPDDTRLLQLAGTGGVRAHDVVLSAGVAVTGRVLDEQGRPVAGAEVQVLPAEAPSPFAPPPRVDGTLTNEAGRYTVDGLVPGRRHTVIARATGRAPLAGPPFLLEPSGATEAPPLTLPPGARVRVRAVTWTGEPLPGAQLSIRIRRRDAPDAFPEERPDLVAAPDGLAQVDDLPPGTLLVTATHPDHGPGTVEIEVSDAGPPDQVFEVRLTRAARLEGRVVDGQGAAVGRAVVLARAAAATEAPPCAGALADDGGRFALENLPGEGRYRLQVLAPGHEAATLEVETGDGNIEIRATRREQTDEAGLDAWLERAVDLDRELREAPNDDERRRARERFQEWMEGFEITRAEGGAFR